MELKLKWTNPLASQGFTKPLVTALSKAGGDAIRGLKITSRRYAQTKKRMKAGRLNAGLPLTFPKGVTYIRDLEWRMDVTSDYALVSSYTGARQTRLGVTVGINKGTRALIKGAFIATMKSGHVGVFLRTGPGRFPIKELFTTRVADVFNDNGMTDEAFTRAQETFSKSFERLYPLELAKR